MKNIALFINKLGPSDRSRRNILGNSGLKGFWPMCIWASWALRKWLQVHCRHTVLRWCDIQRSWLSKGLWLEMFCFHLFLHIRFQCVFYFNIGLQHRLKTLITACSYFYNAKIRYFGSRSLSQMIEWLEVERSSPDFQPHVYCRKKNVWKNQWAVEWNEPMCLTCVPLLHTCLVLEMQMQV